MAEKRLLEILLTSIKEMGLEHLQLGAPQQIEKEVQRAERLFKDYSSKSHHSKDDAYSAALKLVRGEVLDSWSKDIVAAAIAIPLKERKDLSVIETPHLEALLNSYREQADRGELWRLTWYSLFNSYLSVDPSRLSSSPGREGFSKLRTFLRKTWPTIDSNSGDLAVPDWVQVLRVEPELLSDNPAQKYATAVLAGDFEKVNEVQQRLGIPASGWFREELVIGAVKQVILQSEREFKHHLPAVIALIKTAPTFRDRAICAVLKRYYECQNRSVDPQLRDYLIQPSVWRNPKLKAAGIATAWNQVSDFEWRMVMGWVNERNLRDFFDILASRNGANQERLKFWSKYMNQIAWTRLIFGHETIRQKTYNPGIRALLESEEGTYARLRGSSDKTLDAFMMQLGDYLVVEFSKTGHGGYVYRLSDLPFNQYTAAYQGTTEDLKSGFYQGGKAVVKIFHTPGWEGRIADELRRLGIQPDSRSDSAHQRRDRLSDDQKQTITRIQGFDQQRQSVASQTVVMTEKLGSATARNTVESQHDSLIKQVSSSSLTVDDVKAVIRPYWGASIIAETTGAARRIKVTDRGGNVKLEAELKSLGFRWSQFYNCWVWTEE